MTDTTIHASARVKQWDDEFFMEMVRANLFRRYMGTNENAVIQINERLTARRGDEIRTTLVGALRGAKNNGTTALAGNEKQLFNYAWGTTVRTVRDAVVVDLDEDKASPIDIRNAARQALRDLSMDYLKGDIIASLDDRTASPNVGNGDAGTMTDDQWDAANNDRVVYGETASAGTGFQSQLNTLPANTVGSVAVLGALKNAALDAGGKLGDTNGRPDIGRIRPIRVDEDEEWFVAFVPRITFNNIKADPVMAQANREAWQRYGGNARTGGSGGNPLFRGGDLVYDGIIVREIVEMRDLDALTGSLSGPVDRIFFCGAQAAVVAWGNRTQTTVLKEDDYEYRKGVGFQEIRGTSKMWWEGAGATARKQWGMVTGFVAQT